MRSGEKGEVLRGAGPKNDFFQVSFFVLFVAVLCFYVVGKNKNALGIGLNAPNAQAMRIFIFHFFYVSMPAVGFTHAHLKKVV